MYLSGPKLVGLILGTLLVGGAGGAVGGTYLAEETEPAPRTTSFPKPSPSASINIKFSPAPGFANRPAQTIPAPSTVPLAVADQDNILRVARAYDDAQVFYESGNNNQYVVTKVSGNFALVAVNRPNESGLYQILKKSRNVWVVLYEGDQGPEGDIADRFGIPPNLLN